MLARKKFLGNYQILKTIGQGAFSKVKLGIHKETGQKVAIKIIDKKEMAAKAAKAKKATEERERKRKEAEAQQQNQRQERARRASGATPYNPDDPTTPHRRRSSANPEIDKPPERDVDPRGECFQDDPNLTPSRAASVKRRATQVSTGKDEEGGDNVRAKEEKVKSPESTTNGEAETGTPSFMSTLQLEVQLLMRLDHPNIINLYQVMDTEDECFVVMEYAAGGELIDYIAARNYLTEKEARRLFRQILSAMDHCHMANVVHRDLKLENLLLTDQKNILISDFGLGRTFLNDKDDYMKTFCGTPNYAAVELISGIPYIGVKADIWALGVVLFVMMTGRPPFTGDSISALYSKIKAVDYKCPDYFSKELRSLLSKILRRDPKARIDMETLRSDPWVNYEEAEPPIRIMPKVTGPPDPSHLGQLIRSINRDSSFVVFTIRQHMRNGVNIDGASVEKNKTLQKSVAAAATAQNAPSGYHGGRRRSHSMGPPTHANIGMAGGAASASPSSPNRIGEDDEEEIGELPSSAVSPMPHSPTPVFQKPSMLPNTRNRRMSMQETSLSRPPPTLDISPPPNEGVRENFFPPRTSAVAQTPQPPSSQPPQRQRRNTITTLFQSGSGVSGPGGFLGAISPVGGPSSSVSNRPSGTELLSPDDRSFYSAASRSRCEISRETLASSREPSTIGPPDGLSTSMTLPASHFNDRSASVDSNGENVTSPGTSRNSRRASATGGAGDRNMALLRRMSMVSPPMERRGSASMQRGAPDWDSLMTSGPTKHRRRSSEVHGSSAAYSPNTSSTQNPVSPSYAHSFNSSAGVAAALKAVDHNTSTSFAANHSKQSFETSSTGNQHDKSVNSTLNRQINSSHGGEDALSSQKTHEKDAKTTKDIVGDGETGSDDSALDLVPSRKEIEEWHLLHRPPREIRTVRYSFNPSLTSTLSPSQVFQDVHRVLVLLQRHYSNRLSFIRNEEYYLLRCKLADIDGYDHGESSAVDFEVEVCKIWLLKLHGVRIKRISGNALMFKDVYSNVCELLNIRG